MTFPGTSGFTCTDCNTWVPVGVTHQCQGKFSSGLYWNTWCATPDWTSFYLARLVGLLVKIEGHLQPIAVEDVSYVFGNGRMGVEEMAAEVEAHFANTNKEKSMAMSDVVRVVLLDALQNARDARRRAHSSTKELRAALGHHETALENAIVTIGEITNALVWGGVEIPPETE